MPNLLNYAIAALLSPAYYCSGFAFVAASEVYLHAWRPTHVLGSCRLSGGWLVVTLLQLLAVVPIVMFWTMVTVVHYWPNRSLACYINMFGSFAFAPHEWGLAHLLNDIAADLLPPATAVLIVQWLRALARSRVSGQWRIPNLFPVAVGIICAWWGIAGFANASCPWWSPIQTVQSVYSGVGQGLLTAAVMVPLVDCVPRLLPNGHGACQRRSASTRT